MAEACYTARATMKQQVLNRINKLTLQTNKHGQYTHDVILLLQKGVQRVLISQFNPSDPGNGMVKLLDNGTNILTQVKSTNAITAGSVLKLAKKQADELTTTTGKTIFPTFTTQTEAQEEADRLNVINQSVIGAKEGVVKALTKLVGSDITNTILQTADSSDHKRIDDFTLFNVMKVAINEADWPPTNDVLEQVLEVINHTFNFCKKVSINMELMQSNAAQMATYGIVIGIPQPMLTLLTNIETATKSDYGREFRLAMHAIHKKYVYNHVHDAKSLQTILTELAGADGVRALKDALAPNATTGCSVANPISFLNTMMNNDTTASKYTESAYGASSDSGLLEEQRKSRERDHKKTKMSKSREKKKKEKDKDKKTKKEHMPPLQNIPPQEVPSH
jgi:hypothetical protein